MHDLKAAASLIARQLAAVRFDLNRVRNLRKEKLLEAPTEQEARLAHKAEMLETALDSLYNFDSMP